MRLKILIAVTSKKRKRFSCLALRTGSLHWSAFSAIPKPETYLLYSDCFANEFFVAFRPERSLDVSLAKALDGIASTLSAGWTGSNRWQLDSKTAKDTSLSPGRDNLVNKLQTIQKFARCLLASKGLSIKDVRNQGICPLRTVFVQGR